MWLSPLRASWLTEHMSTLILMLLTTQLFPLPALFQAPWNRPVRFTLPTAPQPAPSHTTRIIPSSANHIQRCASVVLFMERHSFCFLNNWSVSLYFFYSASGCNRTLFSLVMPRSLFCSIFAFASLQFTSGWKWAGACKQMSRWLARGSFFFGQFWFCDRVMSENLARLMKICHCLSTIKLLAI